MEPQHNAPLASYTSLGVGGPADTLLACHTTDELIMALQKYNQPICVLGYGANVLISDAGLRGVTLALRSTGMQRHDTTIVAESGTWWDDLVKFAISKNLWGLELTSGVPGSVGAAVVGNIAAYGQAVADTLAWVEVYDSAKATTRKIMAADLELSYRYSNFQNAGNARLVILRAAFALSATPTVQLTYQSALDIASELRASTTTLKGRRKTILETRKRAGSLWNYKGATYRGHTAGSFFRNPLVSTEKAEQIMGFDETGKSLELLKKMNQVHGGEQKRVSAAHVLLAAGFSRGQSWGPVRLHPDHILKLENTGDATAQQIYDIAQEIIAAVQTKLGVELTPEVRFLGTFKS